MNLTIKNLSKSFGDKNVLDDVSIKFSAGVYGILGANGSGKTTLMRILASVLKPSGGQVYFNNQDIVGMDEAYRDVIGYLPQHVGFYKNFTAEKFLLYIAALKGLPKDKAKVKVDEVLELVGLSAERKGKVGRFSGGMKQRVGIAQALLNDPKVLIVDEPTAGLDPKERIRFRNLLAKIAINRIVLLSTHIVSDIEFIAREVVILKDGKLLRKDSPQDLLDGIADKVWSVKVPESEIASFQAEFKVGNIGRVGDGVFDLRILSDSKPHPAALNEAPNLEDLYLYYFDEEVAS
ncbi:ABC transporter ATP-binding protein [Sutcliffiella horikoshii]|uniref:ABC transporter ATP-binding protein n=1 Tax=Sutcliffiella horikoshii TaxID=79883 RepID=UPI001CBC5CEF|nr:ABC transporter ATP-binding protein [Sutcliffiella horikoshii]UAL47185.1 ABC transporter ATP-binding protein [Sutcliffiella horikoshii]